MRLLVDIGNSCIKWATYKDGVLSPQHSHYYPGEHLDTLINQLWTMLEIPTQGVWIASVAQPQLTDIIRQWIAENWQLKPTIVKTTQFACGVTNGYINPQQLGIDRWLALIAAHHLQIGNLCIVNCGTAVTIDVLTAQGQHQGGLIVPGITTMYNALLNHTHALAKLVKDSVAQSGEPTLLACDTWTGIHLGTVYAVVGLVEYLMKQLEQEQPTLLMTGGHAPDLLSFLTIPYQHIPDLVLQGLVVLGNDTL